jgi:hypothetical protein
MATIPSATLISLIGLALAAISLVVSRIVTRRIRVTVHAATFVESTADGFLSAYFGGVYYFVNVTNLSLNREVEITHVWFDCPGKVHVLQGERPLPKRLKADETWETWIRADALPATLSIEDACCKARVLLSTGKVFNSKRNKTVPDVGSVPGGELGDRGVTELRPVAPGPLLRESARELLLEASNDGQGVIMNIQTMDGSSVKTNGRDFITGGPRSVAQWRGAVAELDGLRLIEDRAGQRKVFFVTEEGYRVAELLKQQ